MKQIFPEFQGRKTIQPIPAVTLDDVERIVQRDFPRERFGEVMAVLNEYGQRERARVQLAVLKLAAGSLESLRQHVAVARQDFRDILVAAEYPGYSQRRMLQVPKLPIEEQQRIIEADWAQYEAWLQG